MLGRDGSSSNGMLMPSSKADLPARLLRRWERLWDVPGLAAKATVMPNPHLRSTLGRFIRARGRIELHPELFRSKSDLLAEVLCHEAAHLAVLCKVGNARPHGREWASFVRAAGFDPKVRPSGACLPRRTDTRRTRYEHRCPVCQAVRLASRPVPNWRCASCAEAGLPGRMVIVRRST